eukprot:2833024-Rhodomonas_salina.1
MSGTDTGPLVSYAVATGCPVLTRAMLLRGGDDGAGHPRLAHEAQAAVAMHTACTPRNPTHEAAIPEQFVPGTRCLVFDFGGGARRRTQ